MTMDVEKIVSGPGGPISSKKEIEDMRNYLRNL